MSGAQSNQRSVEHFRQALQEASEEPGATVHFAQPGTTPAPQLDEANMGTRAADLEGRDIFVAPSTDGKTVDVVERIDMDSGAIKADVRSGFGAHEGAVAQGEGAGNRGGRTPGGYISGSALSGSRDAGGDPLPAPHTTDGIPSRTRAIVAPMVPTALQGAFNSTLIESAAHVAAPDAVMGRYQLKRDLLAASRDITRRLSRDPSDHRPSEVDDKSGRRAVDRTSVDRESIDWSL